MPLAMTPWPRNLYRKPMVCGMGLPPQSLQTFPLSGAIGGQPSVTLAMPAWTHAARPLSHSALGLQTVNPDPPPGTLEKSLSPFALDHQCH
jgi:hypothetical protein